ncbi:unnamed protein product [Orchesella dallaii]|uniref:ATP-dependent RNA helicase YTHDC2 n=1 Tax=Orchesella dallaii TaxID=48710 RepID=A0ABP1QFR6_9HEXA
MPRDRGGDRGDDRGEKTSGDIKRLKNIVGKVSEDVKIRLDQLIQDFMARPELKEVTFPKLLSSIDRAYVHYQATKHGLKSFSTGSGSERRLTLTRAVENTGMKAKRITLTEKSMRGISALLATVPPDFFTTSRVDADNLPIENLRPGGDGSLKGVHASRISAGPSPKVPKPRRNQEFLHLRKQLPIWHHQEQILETLEKHRICFIKGATGCGKTTQVPQFILDDATKKSKSVRIICTVPRRIAAVSVSERVAVERGERLGQTVGYQIRLESCYSPCETLLTYCTSGILLRSLSSPNYRIVEKTTHIIIDEIHERDRQTDFLLACLKDIIVLFPNLRVILMGADLNNVLFSSFFGGDYNCPTLQVDGRLYPVETYYLEDILEMMKYETYDMRSTRQSDERTKIYNQMVENLQHTKLMSSKPLSFNGVSSLADEVIVRPDVDELIQQVWTIGDEYALAEYFHMVEANDVSVNYQHSTVGVTMLMAAAVRGEIEWAEKLLTYGADLNIKSKYEDYELSASDWASDHRQHKVLQFLLEHKYNTTLMPAVNAQSMNSEKFQRLTSYLKSVDEERVDLMLILRLLHKIHVNSDPNHAVLVFLPGYDEIVNLKHLVLTDRELGFRHGSFIIFMLHSNIQTGDQRAAFDKPRRGVRKIVLSTNIAESSLTIEDIVYVIDSGKAKEKSFDSMTGVTQLKSGWISKASVNQRRGRAGRCRAGVCYHLFSTLRYESMSEFPIPEIVRTSLQELCLHARSFIKPDLKIERFFMRIPEPPAPIAVKKSVEILTVMGALDENERLTKLGMHLLDFPLEPFLGKALIYAVVFKCLDPILTLVSVISYRDPFQLPSDPRDKEKAQKCKIQFARDSLSDHMAYLKAFQDWETSKLYCEGTQRRFCRDNYLSAVTFEMVYAIRAQLLGQLRASGFVKNKGPSDLLELNTNSDNWALVKGVLVATLYPNICGVDRDDTKKVLYNSFNTKIAFHPSSTLTKKKNSIAEIPTEWIIFDEMTQQGSGNLVKGCTCVSTAAIALFAGSFSSTTSKSTAKEYVISNHEYPSFTFKINQWISLDATKETLEILMSLRRKINDFILKRLDAPFVYFNKDEDATIQVIAAVLFCEDEVLGFPSVEGVGQWPKHVAGNFMSAPRTGYAKTDENEGSTSSVAASFVAGMNRPVFYVVEVSNVSQVSDLIRSGVWLVPAQIEDKFWCTGIVEKANCGDFIVFLWFPDSLEFVGAMKVNSQFRMMRIPEVPVQVFSDKRINFQNVEHVGFAIGLSMDGMELDYELGHVMMKMFEEPQWSS